jgi:hypothetical protein
MERTPQRKKPREKTPTRRTTGKKKSSRRPRTPKQKTDRSKEPKAKHLYITYKNTSYKITVPGKGMLVAWLEDKFKKIASSRGIPIEGKDQIVD